MYRLQGDSNSLLPELVQTGRARYLDFLTKSFEAKRRIGKAVIEALTKHLNNLLLYKTTPQEPPRQSFHRNNQKQPPQIRTCLDKCRLHTS